MIGRTLSRRTAAAALVALVALGVRAATAQEAPGIDDESVRIGITGPLTGPVAAIGGVAEGIRVKVAAVNAAGGVRMTDGKTRKIELVVEDDGLDPQRTLGNVRKMAERDGVFAVVGTAGTPNNQAIGRYIERRGLPDLFMYSGVHELPEGRDWLIGLVPSFTTEAAAFGRYLKDSKPGAKVALLYLNTETGLVFRKALEEALAGSTVTIVAAQPVTATDPTVDTQMSNLRASGADTLVIIAAPRQGAQAVRVAAESGWRPTTLLSYIASAIPMLKPAGLDNAKGLISTQFIKTVGPDEGDPGIARYRADYAAAGPAFGEDDAMLKVGYLTGEALVHVLGSMTEPTRAAAMAAARGMKEVESALLLPGIRLGTDGTADIYPVESLQLVRFDGTNYEPVGPVISFEGGRTPRS